MKSSNSHVDANEEKTNDDDSNDIESRLLIQTDEEEKARKRTRGPYRKSSGSIIRSHD
jgi:hypothetical protein